MNSLGRPKGISNRHHSKEFKMGAVQKVLSGRSAVEVARELGINDRLVRRISTL
ncbi:MAG: transposase [Christensenellales bacterium]